MPSANILTPPAVTRFNTLFPGNFGIAGASNSEGLRMDTLGKIFYVDPNFPGASTTADGTDSNCPVSTITAALSRCTSWQNDTIVVMMNDGWQHGPIVSRTTVINETVAVNVHGVRIVGVGPSATIGPAWRPAAAGLVACTVNALDVLIEGFCFDGWQGAGAGGTGIYSAWNGTTAWGDNLTVRHCYFGDHVDIGIQLEFAYNCEIHHNWFQEADTYGIYSDPAGSPPAYCHIHDNWFHNVGVGAGGAIVTTELTDSLIEHNWIFNSAAQAGAAATDEGIVTALGGANIVSDNYLSCILPAAAPGDYDDMNSGSATDCYVNNHCSNGMAITTPT